MPKSQKKKDRKKHQRSTHQENLNIESYNGLVHLLEDLELSFAELGLTIDDFSNPEDEYLQHLKSLYEELRAPIIRFNWILHPFKMRKYCITCGNENIISASMKSLVHYDEKTSIIEFDLDTENYLYQNIREYKQSYSKYHKLVTALESQDDLAMVRRDLKKQCIQLISNPLEKCVEDLRITDVNVMIYFTLALYHFQEELIEEGVDHIKMKKTFYRIEDYVTEKRMKRAETLLEHLI
ncbi:MAG: hypothetical protein INQ03_09480 [Candidatus Heimdallarchaeota archaeon]|nr:hypothetical protein [Candidatus Heimdallarchaeota archaeon]